MEDFPSGKIEIYSRGNSIDTKATKEEAAAKIALINTPENLREGFFTENEHTLQLLTLPSGSMLSLIHPTGAYSEEAVLLTAAGPESLREGIGAESIYDLPTDAQYEYWRIVVNGLKFFTDQSEKDGSTDATTFAVENNINGISSAQHRLSRSIRLPHIHLVRLHRDEITAPLEPIEHLDYERQFLQRTTAVQNFAERLRANIAADFPNQAQDLFTVRERPPYGYAFSLAEGASHEEISAFLRAHHESYKKESLELFQKLRQGNQERLIPQPSYRLYLSLDKNNSLSGIISPEFLSHAGAMEAADMQLNRSSTHPRRRSPEAVKELHQQLTEYLFPIEE